MNRRAALGLAVLVQVVVLLVAVGPRLLPRLTGDELRLLAVPVDPIDPFRGAYVDLRVDGLPTGSPAAGTVYVTLVDSDVPGVLRAGPARTERPAEGRFLRCTAEGGWAAPRCGVESFFASQDEARRLERELGRRGAILRVRVDQAGRAALVGLDPRP